MNSDNKDEEVSREWSKEDELILKDWADKAVCYKWLHTKSYKKYSAKYARFTIPVIIISTLTGTANFAQDRVPEEYKSFAVMTVGALNIIAGIITTISQYFKLSELTESHRVAYISWDKFYRNLKVELAKKPELRTNVIQVMKYAKDEFDRLMDTSPDIPTEIITTFTGTFKDNKVLISAQDIVSLIEMQTGDSVIKSEIIEKINEKYNTETKPITLPEICDTLTSTHVYQRPKNENNQKIELYKLKFREKRGREPTNEEIELGIELT